LGAIGGFLVIKLVNPTKLLGSWTSYQRGVGHFTVPATSYRADSHREVGAVLSELEHYDARGTLSRTRKIGHQTRIMGGQRAALLEDVG